MIKEEIREPWGNPQGELCPKCEKNKLYRLDVRNSLSRKDNETYICPDCGDLEALEVLR